MTLEVFEAKLTELKGVVALRRCGSEHAQALEELERRTVALEAEAAELQRRVENERTVLEQEAAELRTRAVEQQEDIAALNAALPSRMKPRTTAAVSQQTTATSTTSTTTVEPPPKQKRRTVDATSAMLTDDDLAAVPGYMRGRLTAERCNEALAEAIRLVHARYKLLAGTSRDDSARRDKARDLEELAKQQADYVAGTRFFSEADIATSSILKLDTAGRMLLSTLRHLGRLKEFSLKGCKCWVVV